MTNRAVWNWYVLENMKSYKVTTVRDMFMEKFHLENCTSATWLNTKLKDLLKKERSMKYQKTPSGIQRYVSYMSELFKASADEARSTNECEKEEKNKEEKRQLKRKIALMDKDIQEKTFKNLENEALLEVVHEKNERMEEELTHLKQEVKIQEEDNKKIISSNTKERDAARREIAKQVRKNEYSKEKMNEMKDTMKVLKEQNENLVVRNKLLKESMKELEDEVYINIEDLKKEKKQLQRKLRTAVMKDLAKEEKGDNEAIKLKKEVKELNRENKELSELAELLRKDEIVTFEDGKYTNEIREVVMELMAQNVSIGRVNNVITTVLKLASKTVNRLPSAGVKSRILQESLTLVQKQVAEAMLEGGLEESSGNVLHGDGTSKYHRHYQNFQITTKSGRSYSFGLSEVACGDVTSTLNALSNAIHDLTDALKSKKDDKKFAELVASIKSTMSDLGPINPGFNAKLKELRKTVLPKAVENWNELTNSQQNGMIDMANFFCRLHLLANFASECDKVLNLLEGIKMESSYSPVLEWRSSPPQNNLQG